MARTRVDTDSFQNAMRRSGFTLETLSAELALSRTGLFNKIHNKTEFKASEIAKIAMLLKLKNAEKAQIFFAVDVE